MFRTVVRCMGASSGVENDFGLFPKNHSPTHFVPSALLDLTSLILCTMKMSLVVVRSHSRWSGSLVLHTQRDSRKEGGFA